MQTKITLLRRWKSLRLALLALLLTISTLITRAQAPNAYSFSSSTNTYTPITGGTVLGIATNDDDNFNALPIGFTFSYNGIQFTTASVNANGFLALGSTVISSYTSISSGTSNNVIAALNRDLQGNATTGNLSYLTTGTAPNRVFTVQWTSYSAYGASGDDFNFQIKLYETTNEVQICYGSFVKNATSRTVQVGLRGSSNAVYNNRTTATNWATSTAGTINSATMTLSTTVIPASGLTFTFIPPAQTAPAVTTGTKTNITSSTVTLAGTVVPNSFPVVTASGIVVGTTPNPIIGGVGVIDSATNPVVTSGSFTRNIDGLQNGTTYYYRAYATNAVGTSYGPDSTFTTNASASLPAINRIVASAVTGFTANIGGNILNNGGSAVTASGIVYSTTPNPALFGTGVIDSTTNPLVALGNFNFNLAGLTHSTKYYYRAYATNSVGTAYSVQDSFTTSPVISVLPYTENFDLPGNTGWSSTALNTGTNSWQLGTPSKTNLNNAFSGSNAWVTSLTGNYAGTEDCAVVSPQMDFSALTATPILRFKHEMDVDADLGWDGGVVEISINGGAWTRLDPVAGTAPSYNTTNSLAWYNNTSASGALGSPKFSANTATTYPGHVNGWITSSTPLTGAAGQSNVRVRFRFWADGFTDEGWALDNIEVFAPSAPTVLTGTKTNVTTSNATLAGNITNNGGNAVTASGVVISTSPNPTRATAGVIDSATTPLVGNGTFSVNVSGLSASTTYYYRAYAVNPVGTSYGPDSTFTTASSAIVPTVLRNSPTSVQAYTATVGGNITSDGGSVVLASGIVYSTSPNPALFGTGVVDSTTNPVVTTGTFTTNLGGLTHSTKYYYRAYATNSVGTAYSAQDSFTTAPVVSALPYFQNFDTVMNSGWTSAPVTGTLNDWVIGTPAKTFLTAAFSAPNAMVTKLTGNYSTSHNAAITSPQLDFSSLTGNPILRFKHKFTTESCCDGGLLEISINGGAWTKVENFVGTGTNFNTTNGTAWYNVTAQGNTWGNVSTGYSTASNGWITSSIALPGTAGQANVKIRFRFVSDGSVESDGWAIDDVELFAPAPPTVQTGTKNNITTSSVTLSGNITNNGGNTVTASGVVISTSPSPVRGGLGVIDSASTPLATNGVFNINVGNLSAATTYYYRAYAVNGMGTSYGADSTFTTNASAVVPSVLRTVATNLQAYTATVGGNITSDGGSAVLASGIVFSTTPNPALFGTGVVDSTTNPVVTTGLFTINLGGLTHSTKYYYRAYATNSVGTAYSVQDSFTTAPVISVLPYTQNFDLPGNTGWSSTALNTGTNSWQLGTPSKTNLNNAFSGSNAWVTNLTGNYAGTEDCAVVSPQMDFSALTATPILRFKHEMDVDADLGWDAGVVEISINGGAWTRLDPVAGTAPSYNTANSLAWYNNTSTAGALGSPKFSANTATTYPGHVNGWITSSTPLTGAAGQSNVRVRFRFWADGFTDEGWALDNIEVFAPSAPTVLTGTQTNVTTSNATLAGNITNNGGNAVTASGVVISTSPNPTRATAGVIDSATTPVVSNGTFSVNVTGLSASTTYYYRAYAVNPVGTSYGPDSTFTTPGSAIIPTVLRTAASLITTTTATVGGNITSDGGNTVTASGVVYSTTPNPALFGTGVTNISTSPLVATGTFALPLTSLTHSTKYYFRAYATNSIGTAYSVQDSFVTSPIVSTLPYVQNFEGTANTGWGSTTIGTGTNSWQLGTPAKTFLNGAYSGTNAWATRLVGDYLGTEDCAIVSPQFDFTGLTSDPVIRFRHKMDVSNDIGWDGGVVEISINNGAWTRLEPTAGTGTNFNNLLSHAWYNNTSTSGTLGTPKFSVLSTSYSSNTNGWIESATRLTAAAGQSNVKVRFRFWADGFTDEGWAIDDIEVVNVTTPTTAASNVTVNPSATSATVNFTAGNGQGRMVVARLSSTIAVAPTNNTLYNASAVFGSTNTTGTGNFIVYMGNGTSVNVTGLSQLTGYTFDVYEYNGKYMHISFAGAISSNTTTTPVKLVSLKATKVNDDVLVSWATASEVNNRGFNVERSIDGNAFEYVGFVKGMGNSSVTNNYRFEDANAFVTTGVSKLYYRLKQIDNDGKYTYSQIVVVDNNEIENVTVVTYPNPFTDKVTIELQNVKAGMVKIEVLDISGRLITTKEQMVNQNNQTLIVDGLSNLSQGVYFIKVKASGATQISKLIKQ